MTFTNIAFTVPGEPQGKGRARISTARGFARAYTPAKTVAYEGLVSMTAAQAMKGAPPLEGACIVDVLVTCSVPKSWSKKLTAAALAREIFPTKKPDIDNVLKAIFDGMNNVVWKDDTQAVRVAVSKEYGLNPGVFVNVALIGVNK